MKNKIFAIVVTLMLITPVYSVEESTIFSETESVQEEVVNTENEVSETNEETAEVAETQNEVQSEEDSVFKKELTSNPYKQPISKRNLAKKFLLAMAGVVGSSLIIFAGLSIYNRVRENILGVSQNSNDRGDTSLETPDNLTDAVRAFVDKTRWD